MNWKLFELVNLFKTKKSFKSKRKHNVLKWCKLGFRRPKAKSVKPILLRIAETSQSFDHDHSETNRVKSETSHVKVMSRYNTVGAEYLRCWLLIIVWNVFFFHFQENVRDEKKVLKVAPLTRSVITKACLHSS